MAAFLRSLTRAREIMISHPLGMIGMRSFAFSSRMNPFSADDPHSTAVSARQRAHEAAEAAHAAMEAAQAAAQHAEALEKEAVVMSSVDVTAAIMKEKEQMAELEATKLYTKQYEGEQLVFDHHHFHGHQVAELSAFMEEP